MRTNDLRTSVMSGLRWSAAARLLVQGITWAVTIVVVRLVTPEEYGLAAIAGIVAGYLNLLNEFGLSVALVQRRIVDEKILRSVFGFLLTTGVTLCLCLYASSVPIANYFGAPSAAPLISIMGLQFIAMAFCVIPQATLSRELKFRDLSAIAFVTNTAGAACTISLAYLGFGAMALVIGTVATTAARAIALNLHSPFIRVPLFQFARLKSLFGFSSVIIVDRSLWYFYMEIDNVVVGKRLGASALGAYSLALNIASIPMQRAAEIVNSVALPAYSSIQDDLRRVASGYLKSLRLGAVLSFPVFWGMAWTAPDFFGLLFGSKWATSIPIIQIICIAMPIRSLGPLAPPVLMAIGKSGTSVRITIWATVIVPASILIGAQWGLVGVAVAWCIAFPLVFVVGCRYVVSALPIGYGDIGRALAGPALAGALMCLALFGLNYLAAAWPTILRLVADISLGGLIYLGSLRLFFGSRFNEAKDLALGMIGRGTKPGNEEA